MTFDIAVYVALGAYFGIIATFLIALWLEARYQKKRRS